MAASSRRSLKRHLPSTEARRYARGHAGFRKECRRTPYLRVYQESALRAIIECQPYICRRAFFEEWKYFAPVFTEQKT